MSKEPMSEERVDAARNRGLGMTRINDYANTEPAFIRTVGRQMVWLADEIARLRARNEKLEAVRSEVIFILIALVFFCLWIYMLVTT